MSHSHTTRDFHWRKNGTTLVFRAVPARVCSNCGEEYVHDKIAARLLKAAAEAARSGIQVEIRNFSAA
jgi:YgiT-type zinc finger domain-containing protein